MSHLGHIYIRALAIVPDRIAITINCRFFPDRIHIRFFHFIQFFPINFFNISTFIWFKITYIFNNVQCFTQYYLYKIIPHIKIMIFCFFTFIFLFLKSLRILLTCYYGRHVCLPATAEMKTLFGCLLLVSDSVESFLLNLKYVIIL